MGNNNFKNLFVEIFKVIIFTNTQALESSNTHDIEFT